MIQRELQIKNAGTVAASLGNDDPYYKGVFIHSRMRMEFWKDLERHRSNAQITKIQNRNWRAP